MLMDLLNKAVTVAMLGFVVSSMLAMGSGLTIRQIIEPCAMPVWSCLRCWPISS